MSKQLLLCVNDKGLRRVPQVKEGKVYTFALDTTCSCGGAAKTIGIEEVPFPQTSARLLCVGCGREARFPFLPLKANRFVPLNDPDAKIENEEQRVFGPFTVILTDGEPA